MSNQNLTKDFVDSAKIWHEFLRTLKEWNTANKAKYYQLKNDYLEKRKLYAIDCGLDKVMDESMWPR